MMLDVARGDSFSGMDLRTSRNRDSTTTAAATSRLPRQEPSGPSCAPARLRMAMPVTDRAMPAMMRPPGRSPRMIQARIPMQAGVVLVMIPAEAGEVQRRPCSTKMVKSTDPQRVWPARMSQLRGRRRGGRGSIHSQRGTMMALARAKRSREPRWMGKWRIMISPATTELPTRAMAAARQRWGRMRVIKPPWGRLYALLGPVFCTILR
ncbi:hypothetical protein DSECCO2_563340 [anaerobic digester metagenome]